MVEAAPLFSRAVSAAAEALGAVVPAGEAASAAGAVTQPVAAQEEAGKNSDTMKVKHFLSKLEHVRIHQAIRSAEEGTSGDIVLYITQRRVEDPLAAANEEFRKLRLETATDKNSLLILLAPRSQKFAVVGGTALHAKVGQAWWNELIALLARHFKEGRYSDGMVAAIEFAGKALKHHFPASARDRTGQKDIVEE